jgi:RNA polymerase sigma factor (sigma-70 family)
MKFTLVSRDEFIGLILYCVSKHGSTTTVSHFDMLQAGYVGLAKALESYNKNKCPLKNWVYRFINSEIIKCRYKNNKERREDSGYDEIIKNTLAYKKTAINEIYENEIEAEQNEKLAQIYSALNSRHPFLSKSNGLNRRIFKDRIVGGCRIVDLVSKYGLSYASITHRISKVSSIVKEKVHGIDRPVNLCGAEASDIHS